MSVMLSSPWVPVLLQLTLVIRILDHLSYHGLYDAHATIECSTKCPTQERDP